MSTFNFLGLSISFGATDELAEERELRREYDQKAKETEAKAKAKEARERKIKEAVKATDASERRAVKSVQRLGRAVNRLNEAEELLESRRGRRRLDLDALIEAAERGEIPMVEPPTNTGTGTTSGSSSSSNSNSSSSKSSSSKSKETPKQKTINTNEAQARAALKKVVVNVVGSKEKLTLNDAKIDWFLRQTELEALKKAVVDTEQPGLLLAGASALVNVKWNAKLWGEASKLVSDHAKTKEEKSSIVEDPGSDATYTIEEEVSAEGKQEEFDTPEKVEELNAADSITKQEETSAPEASKENATGVVINSPEGRENTNNSSEAPF